MTVGVGVCKSVRIYASMHVNTFINIYTHVSLRYVHVCVYVCEPGQ